jgi:hypothetical protein
LLSTERESILEYSLISKASNAIITYTFEYHTECPGRTLVMNLH